MIYSRPVGCSDCRPRAVGQMDLEALKEWEQQNPQGFEYQFVGGTTLEDVVERRAAPAKTESGGGFLIALLLGAAIAKAMG